jgi:hypothetical protein
MPLVAIISTGSFIKIDSGFKKMKWGDLIGILSFSKPRK